MSDSEQLSVPGGARASDPLDGLPLEVSFSLKKRASRASSGQTCLVSQCDSRLVSNYEKRYRLCTEHMKAPQFLIGGELHRWCQKCGKFHALTQFEGVKRSCVASLQRHNEKQKRLRVRKQAAAAAAAAASGAATPFAAPSPSPSFSRNGTPIEVCLSRAGSDASDSTLGPPPMSLVPSTSPSAVIVVEPLPPPPLVLMLDEMSMAAEAASLGSPPADAATWDAIPVPSPAGGELEIDEFLAELMPEAEMGLDDIDLGDLEGSLFGGYGVAPAPLAALDWAFAQF